MDTVSGLLSSSMIVSNQLDSLQHRHRRLTTVNNAMQMQHENQLYFSCVNIKANTSEGETVLQHHRIEG